jgi:hypothetical protein
MPFHYARSDQPDENIFFDKHHELATKPKYLGLHEWHNQKHRAYSSSVGK